MRIFHRLINAIKRFFGYGDGDPTGPVSVSYRTSVADDPRPNSTYDKFSTTCSHPKESQEGVSDVPGVIRCGDCGAVV